MGIGNGKKGEKSEKGWCVTSSGRKEETKIWEWCFMEGQAWISCTHCSGKNDFGELFSKWGKLHPRNTCLWHQFLLKLKHRPRFYLGLHWNEGQLQITLYFAHFSALGCKTAWIKTGGLRSNYSKNRLNKRVLLMGSSVGGGGSILFCPCSGSALVLVPVVTSFFLMPLELMKSLFTNVKNSGYF